MGDPAPHIQQRYSSRNTNASGKTKQRIVLQINRIQHEVDFAPSSYKPEYKAPAYAAPSYSAPAYVAPSYSAPAYAAPAYAKDNKYAGITVTSQSDERNLDGSSQWSYAQSNYTTREESQVQKKMQGVAYDSYGKATYEDVMGM
ncbi:uncharacterized protein LOC124326948 [Daphnia pulicaria]|uniref:uncharacterized protein LOC124326948 n=1 Tax=Daphnia pulicaria TaxID=35523 RepID=UPI001EEAB316|nr:uncharacterized protein LOC124326948 [Daphnia pulicaria]